MDNYHESSNDKGKGIQLNKKDIKVIEQDNQDRYIKSESKQRESFNIETNIRKNDNSSLQNDSNNVI